MTTSSREARAASVRGLRIEAPRDQEESPFTEVLRRVWGASPGVLAAVFVDDEGECIDYCSGIDPFDAKVAGAHMSVVSDAAGHAVPRLGGGQMHCLEVYGDDREIVARRVDEHYLLVVLAGAGTLDVKVFDQIEAAVAELRGEAVLQVPPWDPQSAPFRVDVRRAVAWGYAPEAFWDRGRRVGVVGVLGWWSEPGGAAGGELSCFRVRTEEGVELTLVHDVSRDRWLRR